MKTLLIISLLFSGAECTNETTVYTCNSPNAKKYHLKENCRGLSGCQHRVIIATLEKAKNEGKTLCNWERDR